MIWCACKLTIDSVWYFEDYFDQPSRATIGTVVAILEIGAFISSLLVGRIGDLIGRRRTILYGSLVFFIGGGLQTFALNMPMMMVGRIVAGFGVGALSTIVPVYQSEISVCGPMSDSQCDLRFNVLTTLSSLLITGGSWPALNFPEILQDMRPVCGWTISVASLSLISPGGCRYFANASWGLHLALGALSFASLRGKSS